MPPGTTERPGEGRKQSLRDRGACAEGMENMRSRQMSKMYASVSRLEIDEQEQRLGLLREAQSGDVGALCILRERYRLRLPLVEARLKVRLPWTRKAAP